MDGWRTKLKSKLGPKLASVVPVSAWHAITGHPIVLPYYHMVSDESVPHLRHLKGYKYKNTTQFRADVDFLLAHWRPITLDDIWGHLYRGQSLPKRSFLLTFDDGFREMAKVVAPILKARGVSAVFFVCPAFVDNQELCFHHKASLILDHLKSNPGDALLEKLSVPLNVFPANAANIVRRIQEITYAERGVLDRLAALCGLNFERYLANQRPYLTSEQIRALQHDGFSIGAHSIDHPFYAHLTLEEQLRQTRESLRFIQERFEVKQKTFAFPHSDLGVTDDFFEKLSAVEPVITFGTGGLLPGRRREHFQRFSMEKSRGGGAREIFAWQSARCWYMGTRGHESLPATSSGKTVFPPEALVAND